ncbi:MAG: DUF475 domain-containing protein [Candidatus Woesebacteria bacterium]|jgi:hypothetical protein
MSEKTSTLRTFLGSIIVTLLTLGAVFFIGGPTALTLVAILAILEVSLSFDNAVMNATILTRMSKFWQKIFLTVGILIAVFGMRMIFPILLVSVTTDMSMISAFNLALNEPEKYQHALEVAHPAIAAFGGVFLLMIVLGFMFESRDLKWIPIESKLASFGESFNGKFGPINTALEKVGVDILSCIITSLSIVACAYTLAPVPGTVLTAGFVGLATYLVVNGLGVFFESRGENEDSAVSGGISGGAEAHKSSSATAVVGKAALFLFLYLEVLDASFSFDGVVGAFAISSNIFIIAAGLGIGAMYIRSITVYLVNQGTLAEYEYLEHGAHWAIGTLAVILLLSIKLHVPEIVTGMTGVGFIALAWISSMIRNRHKARGAVPAIMTQ